MKHFRVEVSVYGEPLVAIESGMLAGKGDLSPDEEEVIREAAHHLLAFVGTGEPVACFGCGNKPGEGGDQPGAEACPICSGS